MRHVIWDWNGTLFDDLHIVVDAVNATLRELGGPEIDSDGYRSHYTRPVIGMYERLLQRPVTEQEYDRVGEVFHATYRELLDRASLNAGTVAALDHARRAGVTQSVLSMWWQSELEPFVISTGIAGHFELIHGTTPADAETKHRHLENHIAALGAPVRTELLVVGDALDDARAAAAAGVPCVVFDGGSHHRRELEAAGMPVADTLSQALELGGVRPPGPS